MNFTQLFILWGLPLILLPVVIHFLNRLRYRSVNWAAMMFLLSANKQSTRHARLKQFLILLMRVLALFFLILTLAQPRVGGWLGGRFSQPPECIIILLDRSASMEALNRKTQQSKREYAIEQIKLALELNGQEGRTILIENATRQAIEINDLKELGQMPLVQATQTGADIQSMLESALNFIIDNKPGKTEIWIISDMQASNWKPESENWETLIGRFLGVDPDLHFRLMSLSFPVKKNYSLSMGSLVRLQNAGKSQLQFNFDLYRSEESSNNLQASLKLNDQQDVPLPLAIEGSKLSYKQQIELKKNQQESGWGRISIPLDQNPADNDAWFVYGRKFTKKTAVFSTSLKTGKLLTLAAAPAPESMNQQAVRYNPEELSQVDLSNFAMVIWHAPFPAKPMQERLKNFVRSGGLMVCFPTDRSSPKLFDEFNWGELELAPEGKMFTISHWDKSQGLLANSLEGNELPLSDMQIFKRRRPYLQGEIIAEFSDENGLPMLIQKRLGQGQLIACATLPDKAWSTLYQGPVLVPMLQRTLNIGAGRLSNARMFYAGEFKAQDGEDWQHINNEFNKDVRWHAGIYKYNDRYIALNRPPEENDPVSCSEEQIETLFKGTRFHFFEDKAEEVSTADPTNIWRLMVYLLLLAMIIEAWLTLSPKTDDQAEVSNAK